MNELLKPTNLRNAATFDKATDILKEILHSDNPDVIGDALEAAASDADLAEAVMFRLLVVVRGWATEDNQQTGVEMVAQAMKPSELVVPSHMWEW